MVNKLSTDAVDFNKNENATAARYVASFHELYKINLLGENNYAHINLRKQCGKCALTYSGLQPYISGRETSINNF